MHKPNEVDADPVDRVVMPGRCNCDQRTHDGSFPLLLFHFPDCREFGPHLRDLIVGLVRGMEAWASDEDGIHPSAWTAYQWAKIALGEPVKTEAE